MPADGLLHDWGVLAYSRLVSNPPAASKVAVLAMDWRSLEASELKDLPRAFMAPVWSRMLETVFAAEAQAAAFDMIFRYSANAFVPNHDRPFLASIAKYRQKVVLARTGSTNPAQQFMLAAGVRNDSNALGLAEQVPDEDGVVRSVPTRFTSETGQSFPTLAAAALRKAGHDPGEKPLRFFPPGLIERFIPTYSLIDVMRCAASGEPEATEVLRRVFSGRIVFIGSVLPEEDRKAAADRLILQRTPFQEVPEPGQGCSLAMLPPSNPMSETVPGIFLHAAAAEAALTGRLVESSPDWAISAVTAAVGAAAAAAGLLLTPWSAAGLLISGLGTLMAASLWQLTRGLWLPVALPVVAGFLSLGLAFAANYMLVERRRRAIQKAFGQYLAPAVVARIAASELAPALGGETRDVTIMFADLSGFTALSGIVGPDELMRITNEYLTLIVEAVDGTGGYVDKFIGDAVMAIWGAPADSPDHAADAVEAACRSALKIARRAAAAQ
ncbi:MAG: CHASE2 domain-containing protein, partial [Rhodospirillales bacterium]|nr:CHASE2 domain-containing protein [Rhodospirillales bacterium]